MTPKIVWIDGWYDSPECVPKQITVLPWAEVVPTPAMTLEEVEKWLEAKMVRIHNGNHATGTIRNDVINDLLAQVRAWNANEKVDNNNEL